MGSPFFEAMTKQGARTTATLRFSDPEKGREELRSDEARKRPQRLLKGILGGGLVGGAAGRAVGSRLGGRKGLAAGLGIAGLGALSGGAIGESASRRRAKQIEGANAIRTTTLTGRLTDPYGQKALGRTKHKLLRMIASSKGQEPTNFRGFTPVNIPRSEKARKI